MNFLFSERITQAIKSGNAQPTLIGQSNASIFNAGSNGEIFQITNTVGSTFYCTGLLIKYDSAFDNCIVDIFNTQANTQITGGRVPLCTIGQPKNLNDQTSILPIAPFSVESGQYVSVRLQNTTTSNLPVFGLAITLYGFRF